MTTVALDLLGGDGAPGVVADAAATLLSNTANTGLRLVLVGPVDVARDQLVARGVDLSRVTLLPATSGVSMDASPLEVVRQDAQREVAETTVVVAARAVRDGLADAWVSVGHTGASVASAVLTLGRITGMQRPALAVVVPALASPVVLLDVGATTTGSVGALEQFAIAGHAFAVAVGVSSPRIGLLTIGSESGKGDELRVETDAHLATSLPARGLNYVGPVEGFDVTRGNRAQVIVTDGFTGNIVLKSIEGAAAWAAHQIGVAYGDSGPARGVIRHAAAGDFAGGLLLGVEGVTVVGHGAGTAAQVIGCVELARRAVEQNLIGNISTAMAELS
ncbi:unannotated protein [freshwater metagenome]|uniref:phosphate acyltransferase n=1 Tax=freshwater metagenome TaxID=449393 RepID=A0A6J6HHF3_9ZZZZ|nr:phosphate acyltransferase PlsX [Actinomycetota bacterium]